MQLVTLIISEVCKVRTLISFILANCISQIYTGNFVSNNISKIYRYLQKRIKIFFYTNLLKLSFIM